LLFRTEKNLEIFMRGLHDHYSILDLFGLNFVYSPDER
jgi:hypothetical protein